MQKTKDIQNKNIGTKNYFVPSSNRECCSGYYYALGYMKAKEEQKDYGESLREQVERKNYFLKQKLLGLLTIVLSVWASIFLVEARITLLIMIPLGIGLITSKEMFLINDYYFQEKEKKNKEDSANDEPRRKIKKRAV